MVAFLEIVMQPKATKTQKKAYFPVFGVKSNF
jgi:hypothetical protein